MFNVNCYCHGMVLTRCGFGGADIMGYYSRQTCGNMIRTVFKNVAAQLVAHQAALDAGEV
jgi:hypothetical protein